MASSLLSPSSSSAASTLPDVVVEGYIGIDIGTQGLSVLFTDATDLKVLAKGDAAYGYSKEENGCYEQLTSYWEDALQQAMLQVRQQIIMPLQNVKLKVLAIGISGQMHGEVLLKKADDDTTNMNDDDSHNEDTAADDACVVSFAPVRLWCDARNGEEGDELTVAFGVKVPKRASCARFLWTVRHAPDLARQTRRLTTPAGYMAYRLTGRHVLGIGDAAGMFPVDPDTHNYDASLLQIYNQLLQAEHVKDAANNGGQQDDQHHPLLLPTKLESLLPTILRAGQDAGNLTAQGAALLGLPFDNETTVIPVAAGEGDQVAALAGSLIGKSGTVSCSFGTSVCANLVGDHGRLLHVSAAVDHFCAANGKPIHMVWLRNGTTFLNTMVQSYGSVLKTQRQDGDCSSTITSVVDAFDTIMPALVAAAPDCGGLIALPFIDDEPGLGVGVAGLVQAAEGGGGNSSSSSSSTAVILGWTATNATPGNVCKAALLSTIFNLKSGCQVVQAAGNVMNEIVLSGGLTKTPDCGQILADVFNLPVRLLESSEEGCSWGACVLASYRYFRKMNQKDDNDNTNDDADDDNVDDWPTFLAALAEKRPPEIVFQPSAQSVEQYSMMYRKYQKLMNLEPQLRNVVSST